MGLIQSLVTAWTIPDLQRRLKYVLFALAIQVLAIHVPVPGMDREAMARLMGSLGAAAGLIDMFSGGALRNFSVVAMGILPYINASIIMQLMTVAVPALEKKAKEGGESGRKEINRLTRWLTLALALLQGTLLVGALRSQFGLFSGAQYAGLAGWVAMAQVVLAITAGTAFLMWLGDSITEHGIGNGVSIIIFGNILVRLPTDFAAMFTLAAGDFTYALRIVGLVVVFVLVTAGVVLMMEGTRKIPIQHARRVVGGGKVTAGGSSFLPFKVNSAGVMPIIFAMALLSLPQMFVNAPGALGRGAAAISKALTPDFTLWGLFAALVYFVVILFFTYFYTAVMMNIPDMAENLKKWNAFIPGIRPGKDTTQYLDKVMTRITLAGAIFLSLVALIQFWAPRVLGIHNFSLYGGTSLLIVVGVALETMRAIEAQLMMRHYEGFIK